MLGFEVGDAKIVELVVGISVHGVGAHGKMLTGSEYEYLAFLLKLVGETLALGVILVPVV